MKREARVRNACSLSRRNPVREPRKVLLIVSEGEKTEQRYFESLRNEWRLSTTEVIPLGLGATPGRVVETAIKLRDDQKEEAKRGNAIEYDEVWCVVDRDTHQDLNEARVLATQKNIRFVLSTPCFEIWFLLHFKYSTKPFNTFNELKQELKRYIPDYDKADDYFLILEKDGKLNCALDNARRLRKHNQTARTGNPATDVDLLVAELKSLADS